MNWKGAADPMEENLAAWLRSHKIKFIRADAQIGLDFYLPDFNIYIEVKRFHSPRISDQMSRAKNVIAIQGEDSIKFLKRAFVHG